MWPPLQVRFNSSKIEYRLQGLGFNLTLNPKPYKNKKNKKNRNSYVKFPYLKTGSHLGQQHRPH
jgi:hypothetical protein